MRRVYAIELRRTAFARALNRATSPTGLPCIYVGQSWHSPEARFTIHLCGTQHASGWVRDFGLRLRPELYADVPPVCEIWRAESLEASLAERLREIGFTTITDGRVLRPKGTDVHLVALISTTVEDILDQVALRLAALRRTHDPRVIAGCLVERDEHRHGACVGRFAHVAPDIVAARLDWLSDRGYLATAARQ